jgi:hypothetical protein
VWHLDIPFVHVADAAEFATFAEAGFIKVAWALSGSRPWARALRTSCSRCASTRPTTRPDGSSAATSASSAPARISDEPRGRRPLRRLARRRPGDRRRRGHRGGAGDPVSARRAKPLGRRCRHGDPVMLVSALSRIRAWNLPSRPRADQLLHARPLFDCQVPP